MLDWGNCSEERLSVRVGSTLWQRVCLYCVGQGHMGVAGFLTVGIGASEVWGGVDCETFFVLNFV